MAFVVGQKVWFKRAGSTPFVTGDAADATVEFGKNVTGRGKSIVTFTPSSNGLGAAQGVPQIAAADIPTPLNTTDATTGTFSGGPQGVVEGVTSDPLAPGIVTVSGIFAPPTDVALFNPGKDASGNFLDDGATDRNRINTINTQDPNVAVGRSANSGAAVAEGPAISISGSHEFVSETVDLKSSGKKLGVRSASNWQEAGIVIQVVTGVSPTTVSPDGTRVGSTRMYQVNWGLTNPSKPHQSKWFNGPRELLHAEENLVAA